MTVDSVQMTVKVLYKEYFMKIKSVFRNFTVFFLALSLCLGITGCSNSIGNSGNIVDINSPDGSGTQSVTREYLPKKREDGRKFKMAFVDIDPYNESFRMLYYVIESLKADGWISYDKLPYDPETDADTLAMMNWLADNAESEYMEFDKDVHFYTTISTEQEIYDGLKEHIEKKKDIDMIFALGTSPSLMLKKFDFDIPLVMYGISDAVGAGVVESAENSGDSRFWAHVDSSTYYRQMQYYYDSFEFKKLGVVYGDASISGMGHYRRSAEDNGFEIDEYRIVRSLMDEDEYYSRLTSTYKKMINEDKVDAYILTTDVIPSTAKARELLQVFFDANIPVFTQVSSAYVADGAALMIVDPFDAVSIGPFISNIIGSVFNGSRPGDLEQEYVSSPFLTLNLDVADAIGYRPPFEMLIACEKIICDD